MLSAQPTHISDYAPCFSFTLLSLVLLARAAQAFAHVHKALGRAHGQANHSPGDTSTSRVSRHHCRWYCWLEQDTSLYMCTRHWSELTDRRATDTGRLGSTSCCRASCQSCRVRADSCTTLCEDCRQQHGLTKYKFEAGDLAPNHGCPSC